MTDKKLEDLIEYFGAEVEDLNETAISGKDRDKAKQAILDYVDSEKGKAYQKTYNEAYGKGYNFAKEADLEEK